MELTQNRRCNSNISFPTHLPRIAVYIESLKEQNIILQFVMHLPAEGCSVIGERAIDVFDSLLHEIIRYSLMKNSPFFT